MFELFGGSLVYSVLKDMWAVIRPKKRRLTPEDVLRLRQKWKKEIQPILWERSQKKLRLDGHVSARFLRSDEFRI